MLADQLDYVVGVDPHRDSHALAVVRGASAARSCSRRRWSRTATATREALRLAEQHAPGRRAFAVEGTGSFGAGLTRFLTGRGERVLEVGRLRRERRSGGKTDALDAVRAARSVLDQERPATPRAGGEREALQALVAAREGAVNAKRAGLCQLRDLLITTPEPLRSELRPLTRARLLQPPRSNPTRPPTRPRAARQHARAALDRPTRAAADRRGTRARTRDRNAHPQARTAAARPARRRPARRRAARALLVTPRPDQLRGRLRTARRRRTDPRLLRPNDPLPPRPQRRPQTQPRTAHDPRHTQTLTPRHDRLHRTTHPRRQDTTRSKPLPQALPRPQPLPATRTRSATGRLDRHRSIAGASERSVRRPDRRLRQAVAHLAASGVTGCVAPTSAVRFRPRS